MLLTFFCLFIFAISESRRTKPCHALSFSHISYDNSAWNIYQTDDQIESHIYSNTDDAVLSLNFVASRYWVEGSTYPIYGSAQIHNAKISLNGEHKNNYVYFKSGSINQTDNGLEHNLVIKNVPHRGPISFSRLLYNYLPSRTDIKDKNLIRIYHNEIEFDPTSWTPQDKTLSTSTSGASASCHFNGIKAYIYATKCSDGGLFGVYIDDEFQDIINLQSTDTTDSIVYESNDLPFGQHKIEVRSVSSKTITLICFLYQPYLIFKDLIYATYPGWTTIPETDTDRRYLKTSSASYTFTVRGTRFWLVGLKGPQYHNFTIQFSNLESEVVSTYSETEFHSVLLYESPVIAYGSNRINVTSSGPFAYNELIFSQQPKDAVIIYGKDLKMSESSRFDLSKDTYGITGQDSTAKFSYYGNEFIVYGTKDNRAIPNFSVTDNGTQLTTSDQPETNEKLIRRFKNTPGLGNHEITITLTGNSNYLYINYIFYSTYSNPPSEPYLNLTKDDIIDSLNAINTYDDYIELPVIGSKVVFEYSGSNFALEGYLGPASGNVNIYHNDDLLNSNVPLYREENKFSWFYSSVGLQDDNHRITIVNCNGNPVYISKLCYNQRQP